MHLAFDEQKLDPRSSITLNRLQKSLMVRRKKYMVTDCIIDQCKSFVTAGPTDLKLLPSEKSASPAIVIRCPEKTSDFQPLSPTNCRLNFLGQNFWAT